jgi:hypothetical protein
MQAVRSLPLFQRNILSQCSESNSKPNLLLAGSLGHSSTIHDVKSQKIILFIVINCLFKRSLFCIKFLHVRKLHLFKWLGNEIHVSYSVKFQ